MDLQWGGWKGTGRGRLCRARQGGEWELSEEGAQSGLE